jgi:hypothetical protein
MSNTETQKFILDYSKWRCGEGGAHEVGKGQTALLNSEGYMCCLGQWSLQLGMTEGDILGNGEPCEVKKAIPILCALSEDDEGDDEFRTTNFSSQAMEINDKKSSTPEEKIILLSALCKKNNIELIVINQPENE